MLIDWFTVGAQVLNFLILVWLLKRFLYHPILDAVDARERRIATELADAAKQQAEATAERESFARQIAELATNKAELLKQATATAEVERQCLLDAARQAATAQTAKRQAALHDEAEALHDEIRRKTSQEVFAIAGKTLGDLAGITLETRIVEVFISRLSALSAAEKETLSKALQVSGQQLVVRSAGELPAEARRMLEAAIMSLLGAAPIIRYETVPELVSGIELSADGHKVSWNIADYLARLESSIGELLKPAADAATDAVKPAEGKVDAT